MGNIDAYMIVAPLVLVIVVIMVYVFSTIHTKKDSPVIYDPKKGKKDFSDYR
jgi:uncharacterized membrane protein YqiK